MTATHGNSSRRYTNAQKAEQLVECWRLKVAGHSELEIAKATGIPPTTVHRRLAEAFEARVSPARDEVRAWEDHRLDWVVRTATQVADTADDPEIRLKALDRVMKASERRASMHGANAPTVSLTANTDLPFDPSTEWGQTMAEELAAARADHGIRKEDDDATA